MGVGVKQQQRCARARAEGRLEPCGLRARVAREVEWCARRTWCLTCTCVAVCVCVRVIDVQRVCRAVTARVACRVRRGGGIRSGSGPVGALGGTVAGARLRG